MSITLIRYENEEHTAEIEQEKYCKCYHLTIVDRKYNIVILSRDYSSIKTAKQAVKKYAVPGIILTYDYYREKRENNDK